MAHAAESLSSRLNEATRFTLQIGGLSFGLWCVGDMPIALDPEHGPFLLAANPKHSCDIELDVSWAGSLEFPASRASFHSGGLWAAFLSPTGTQFYLSTPAAGTEPYKAAWFDPGFARGHVVLNRTAFSAASQIFPLEYPLDELMMMHRLGLGEGLEVHALGLADEDGNGYLFLGHSGAGKSTTARLWKSQPGVRLLSDDRVVLRKHDGQFWMYGTPWHGDAGIASPGRARLSAMFLLEQAPVDELLAIAQTKAAAELFARAFVPHYRSDTIQFSLDFANQLAGAVPCSILRFTPTMSAVEVVRHARI